MLVLLGPEGENLVGMIIISLERLLSSVANLKKLLNSTERYRYSGTNAFDEKFAKISCRQRKWDMIFPNPPTSTTVTNQSNHKR